jgi:molybdopterin-guanine dinucleotide biosynthesis protein MobB
MILSQYLISRFTFKIMILAVSGYKGAGKTNFIDGLLSMLGGECDTLVIKGTHGDIDTKGKDTYKHAEAGAFASAIISDSETAVFFSGKKDIGEISLMINADVVLLEGFKNSSYPKIWLEEGEGENIVMRNPSVDEAYNYILGEVEKERILENIPRIDSCEALKKNGVRVTVDGKTLHLNKFVEGLVENTIRGMLSSLKGGESVGGGEVAVKLPFRR